MSRISCNNIFILVTIFCVHDSTAVRVCGQAGNRTNAGRAITPFMFNEEEYVSVLLATLVQTSLGLY